MKYNAYTVERKLKERTKDVRLAARLSCWSAESFCEAKNLSFLAYAGACAVRACAPAINNVGKKPKKCRYLLDGKGEKWYDGIMENISEMNKLIGKNLTFYRKAAGLTQAELAEKINYSDKSVSKWESGNGAPDVYTLMQLAQLYGVTLNDLVGEGTPTLPTKERRGLRGWIILLASGIVWLVATCLYVITQLIRPGSDWWLIFMYAIVANAIVVLVFAAIWKYRVLYFLAISALIWSSMLCLHLSLNNLFAYYGYGERPFWLFYILGAPLQALECMWGLFRAKIRQKKAADFLDGVKEETETDNEEK